MSGPGNHMPKYTVADFVADSGNASESTRLHYRRALTAIETVAKKSLSDLAPSGVVRLMTELRKMHPASVGHDAELLRMFYGRAQGDTTKYAVHIKKAKAVQRLKAIMPPDLLSVAEVQAMIDATQGTRDRALIACLYESGARNSELMSLDIGDVGTHDANGGPARFYLSFRKMKVPGTHHRAVIIEARDYLNSWMKAHPRGGDTTAPLFCTFDGKDRLSRGGAWCVVEGAAIRAGIMRTKANPNGKKIYPHLFRHSRASELIRRHVPPDVIRQMLGWKPGSNMLSRYAHMDDSDAENESLRIAGYEPEKVDYARLTATDEGIRPVVAVQTPPGTPAANPGNGWAWDEERKQYQIVFTERDKALMRVMWSGMNDPVRLRALADQIDAAKADGTYGKEPSPDMLGFPISKPKDKPTPKA